MPVNVVTLYGKGAGWQGRTRSLQRYAASNGSGKLASMQRECEETQQLAHPLMRGSDVSQPVCGTEEKKRRLFSQVVSVLVYNLLSKVHC